MEKNTPTQKKILKFYIKERHNPQFEKPYYVACGQMTKKAAKKLESGSLYGCNNMLPYDSEAEYLAKIEALKAEGLQVQGK